MNLRTLSLFACLVLIAGSLHAETVIKRYDGPLPDRTAAKIAKTVNPAHSISGSLAMEKLEQPTSFYILPFFKIDSTNPGGETTFVSIRNESADTQVVTLGLFEVDNLGNPIERVNALLPKETWVLNLRTVASMMPEDSEGFIRGWGRILGEGFGRISADFFQFNPTQDFATGAMPVDINGGEYCKTVKSRFLVGGTFDGGTLITFMQDLALGGDPDNDPPSITGTAYLEDGSFAGTFEIFTDDFTLEVDAADLLGQGVNFGSLDIVFENNFSGGFAFTEYKANNRFSVGTKSVCLDGGPAL